MPDSNPEPLRVPVGIALLMTNEPRHLLIKLILEGGVVDYIHSAKSVPAY